MAQDLPMVLLVDDDATVRLRTARLLTGELRCAVLEAADAETALALLSARAVHVLVLDLRLSGPSGLALLGDLRRGPASPPVVVLSGLPEVPYAEIVRTLGAVAFVNKERAPEELPALIARLLTPAPPQRPRVLVVDDEPWVAEAIVRLLRRDHDVVTALGAADVMRLVGDGARFDIVLCDLAMPEVDGIELHATLLRSAPELAARMVFMTGGADTERAKAFLDEHPSIGKPFDPAFLLTFIRERIAS